MEKNGSHKYLGAVAAASQHGQLSDGGNLSSWIHSQSNFIFPVFSKKCFNSILD